MCSYSFLTAKLSLSHFGVPLWVPYSRPEQTPPSDLCFSSEVRMLAAYLPRKSDRWAEYERIFERHAAGAKEDQV